MSEKMIEVCLEDYWESYKADSKPFKKASKELSDYLNENLDKEHIQMIDSLACKKSAEAEEQGFVNGFKYAIQFFGILKGGAANA